MRRDGAERAKLRALFEAAAFRPLEADGAETEKPATSSVHRDWRRWPIGGPFRHRAAIAQLVERELPKLEVAGSRPVRRLVK